MLTAVGAAEADDTPLETIVYEKEELHITTKKGPVPVTVEVARTIKQVEHGLMFRTSVPKNTGMIFLFPKPMQVDFWMKNTLVPLDMLFIDKTGSIISIAKRTTPKSTKHIPSGGEALAVIELAAGEAERLHIAKGDKVVYPYFHE